MAKISVAMATYNGAPYLREQLDSLAIQTHLPNELVVCDDGSVDATLSIVQAFALSAPFPVRIYQNEKNLGYSDNFLKAAQLCEGDWVAFCDQDDVWLPHKLKAVAVAVKSNTRLTLVLQQSMLCDAALVPRDRLLPSRPRPGIYGANAQYGFWVWAGFLQTVRADLVHALNVKDRPLNYSSKLRPQSHDKWTCMVANALGGICVLGGSSALYRRHDAALTGDYQKTSVGGKIAKARPIGGDYYFYLARAARSASNYLTEIACEMPDAEWRNSLVRSARLYDRLASIQHHRGRLHDATRIHSRARHFLRVWQFGGYFGPRFAGTGIKSLLKDTSCMLTGAKARSVSRVVI